MIVDTEQYKHSIEEALVVKRHESFNDFIERRYVDIMCFILFKELNEKAEINT